MNLSLAESVSLAREVAAGLGSARAEVALCVPFTALNVVADALKGSPIRLGAQDMHWEAQGAFTGEISPRQLVDCGCHMVIIGHSERRRLFGDTDEVVLQKLKAALEAGLSPILCVGETLEERQGQLTYRVLERQLTTALQGLTPKEMPRVAAAYEPVWAIGTGQTATPAQAQDAHLFLRQLAARLHNKGFADGLRLLYGGSVKAENIDPLMAQPDIDGALVGGESLKPVSFLRIVHFKSPVTAS